VTDNNIDGFEEFDNDWDSVLALSEEEIHSYTYQEVIHRVGSWELPKAYALIVRSQHPETKVVEERCFKNQKRAEAFVGKQEYLGFEVTCYNNDQLYFSPGFAAIGLEDEDVD
jgi:hypothetical protein